MKKITFLLLTFYSLTLIGQIQLTSATDEYFDGTNWNSNNKTVYTYDTNGNLLTEEYLYSEESNTDIWKISSKTLNTYNSNNNLIEQIYEDYDTSTNTISYAYKTVYSYNSQNKLIQMLDYNLENNLWVEESKLILTYNSNNYISMGVYYVWDGNNFVLDIDDSERTTLNYNNSNQLYSIVVEFWNGAAWVLDYKTDNTFSNGKLMESLSYDYNGSTWEITDKVDHSYDVYNNKLSEIYSELINSAWEKTYEVSNTYDTSVLLSAFYHPFKDKTGIEYLFEGGFPYTHKLINTYFSDTYRTVYHYGEATASTKETVLYDFDVYPNPATSILNLSNISFTIKKVELYNVLGKKVLTSTKNKINIENLVKGVYLLKVEAEDGKYATKRIVKK